MGMIGVIKLKIIKTTLMYLIAIILAMILFILFIKIFNFANMDKKEKNVIVDVNDATIDILYTYLPPSRVNHMNTIYSGNYTTVPNISYHRLSYMAYNVITVKNTTQLEPLTQEELNSLNVEGYPFYKISLDLMKSTINYMVGSDNKYSPGDFEITENIKAKYHNNYFYVYKVKEDAEKESDEVVYKGKLSYTITDQNDIKIEEYYLRCSKTTNLCYNDEQDTVNEYIKYTDSIDINNYLKYLQKYIHTYKYDSGRFVWYSVEKEESSN